MQDHVRIVSLEVENVGRLKAIRIVPKSPLVVIGGRNASGKSTILKSILMALGGKSELWDKTVREGEEKGKIVIDLGEITATLSIPKSGDSNLVLKGKDGAKLPSPQSILNKLAGGISFDPLAFTKKRPEEQAAQLSKIVGVDLAPLNAKRKKLYDDRTLIGRDESQLRGQLAGLNKYPDAPAEEVSAAAILSEIEDAQEINQLNKGQRDRLDELKSWKENHELNIAQLEQKLILLNKDLERVKKELTEQEEVVKSLEDTAVEPLKQKLSTVEQTNVKVRANKQHAHISKLADEKTKAKEDLTAAIDKIDSDKMELMKKAKFPLEGLTFDETGVLFNGIPFAQASGAQKLKISFAIWIALNPTLRVILIDQASELDDDNLATIGEMAEKHDVQCWLVRIGKGAECSLIIEDGEVVEVRDPSKQS